MNTLALLLLAIGTALFFPAPGFAQEGEDDLWEVSANIKVDGMSLPAGPTRVCVKDTQSDSLVPMEKDCRITDRKTAGNRTTFRLVCTGKEPMNGTGEMTTGPASYSGVLRLSAKVDGEDTTMTTEFSGKRVGKCTAK